MVIACGLAEQCLSTTSHAFSGARHHYLFQVLPPPLLLPLFGLKLSLAFESHTNTPNSNRDTRASSGCPLVFLRRSFPHVSNWLLMCCPVKFL